MRMRLSDLPPGMQRQVIRKIIQSEEEKNTQKVRKKIGQAKDKEKDREEELHFDSRGEYIYYLEHIRPGLEDGVIASFDQHPVFPLFDSGEFDGKKLRPIRYTSDFRINYADGRVEVIEIKSRFVKRMQRDYAVRRRLFIEKYARPNGWKFTEIITDETKKKKTMW